nr:hypothetical protein [Limosilactobacillus vaginalis]
MQRVLPAFVVLIVCGGIYGAMSGSSKTVSHSASSAKVSSNSSKKDDDDSDESDDDSSDDYDESSDDNSGDYAESDSDTSSDATSNNDDDNTTTKGDMETDQQGTIVGNSRTMVYHTPDQQGYRMSSANAVYFNTEAEAQAAGYRKSEK